jgi:hypothetical protein
MTDRVEAKEGKVTSSLAIGTVQLMVMLLFPIKFVKDDELEKRERNWNTVFELNLTRNFFSPNK